MITLLPSQGDFCATAFFGLIEALQSTFGRPVDLLERRAIRNPYFLRAIEQTRMVVYAAA